MAQYTEFRAEGIWQQFLLEKHRQSAECKLCNMCWKPWEHPPINGLHEHLKRVHDM